MNDKEQIIRELVEKGVFEAIGDAVSIQDTHYKILYQNKSAKDIIGDHVGKFCYKAYEGRDNVCKGCPLVLSFKDGKVHTGERVNPTKAGELIVEITSSAIKVPTGEIIAGIEVVRDITERKRLEENLKISEEKYRLLFSTEQDAIIVVDVETRRIIDANDSALHLYGYSKEEILKLTGPDLSAEPEKSDAAITEIAIAPDKKTLYHTRNHKKKDETVFHVEISSGKFMLKDRKTISAVIRDISDRMKAEQELKDRVEELETFYRTSINRELKMKQLKEENEKLKSELSKYKK
jgi:histidine kinase